MTKSPTPVVPANLAELKPTAFDEIARDLWFAVADAGSAVSSAVSDLHRANGERGRTTRYGEIWDLRLDETIAQIEASPERPVRGRLNLTAGDVLTAYRKLLTLEAALLSEEARMDAEYDSRPWPRYLQTTGKDGHIHSSKHCSTCNKTRRTPFMWLTELSGTPIDQAIKTFQATMCTTCYPDAPVVVPAVDPNVCQGTIKEGTKRRAGISMRGANYWGDCTCGKNGVKLKDDGTMFKHAPAPTARFGLGDRVTHAGDPGRVWVVREVDTTGRVAQLKVILEGGKAVRTYLDLDCSAAPETSTTAGPKVTAGAIAVDTLPAGAGPVVDDAPAGSWYGQRAGRRVCTFASKAAGDSAIRARQVDSISPVEHFKTWRSTPALSVQPEQQHQGADQPVTVVPTFGPLDEVEHQEQRGTVYTVQRVTEAGRVIVRPADSTQTVRFQAVNCRLLRSAAEATAAMSDDALIAELLAAAIAADRGSRPAVSRLRMILEVRHGYTGKGGGHVFTRDGSSPCQGWEKLARLLVEQPWQAGAAVRATREATAVVHLQRHDGEEPVWCDEQEPARTTAERRLVTCRACEQGVGLAQLVRGAEVALLAGEPVRDGDGEPVDLGGLADSVHLRVYFAGRVKAGCGHYMARSERDAGLLVCERCPDDLQEAAEAADEDEDAATIAGSVEPEQQVLAHTLQSLGEPVGEHAQDAPVPAQRPAGTGAPRWVSNMTGPAVAGLREAVAELLHADGFTAMPWGPSTDLVSLRHASAVTVLVDERGTEIGYPDENVGDGEQGEGRGVLLLPLGTSYSVIRDVALGLVAVVTARGDGASA